MLVLGVVLAALFMLRSALCVGPWAVLTEYLLPTLIGLATVAVAFASWRAARTATTIADRSDRLGREERQEARLTDALATLLTEVKAHRANLEGYIERAEIWESRRLATFPHDAMQVPTPDGPHFQLEAAWMHAATREEHEMLSLIADVLGWQTDLRNTVDEVRRQVARYSQFPTHVRAWRNGSVGHQESMQLMREMFEPSK